MAAHQDLVDIRGFTLECLPTIIFSLLLVMKCSSLSVFSMDISPFSFPPEFVRSIQFCYAIATQFLSKANVEVAVLYYSLLSSSSPFSSISLTGGLRPRTALGEKCCTTGIAVSGCSSSQRAMSIISTVP